MTLSIKGEVIGHSSTHLSEMAISTKLGGKQISKVKHCGESVKPRIVVRGSLQDLQMLVLKSSVKIHYLQVAWHSHIFSVADLGLIPLGHFSMQFVPNKYKLPKGHDKQLLLKGPLQLKHGYLHKMHSFDSAFIEIKNILIFISLFFFNLIFIFFNNKL